jgi:hypothetical protein
MDSVCDTDKWSLVVWRVSATLSALKVDEVSMLERKPIFGSEGGRRQAVSESDKT